MALIGDAVKVIDLGDKAMPVLPEDFNRFHGQRAVGHVGVKASFEQPAVGDVE